SLTRLSRYFPHSRQPRSFPPPLKKMLTGTGLATKSRQQKWLNSAKNWDVLQFLHQGPRWHLNILQQRKIAPLKNPIPSIDAVNLSIIFHNTGIAHHHTQNGIRLVFHITLTHQNQLGIFSKRALDNFWLAGAIHFCRPEKKFQG